MTFEYNNYTGALLISERINDVLHKQQYYGYTKQEAKQKFIEYKQKLKENKITRNNL